MSVWKIIKSQGKTAREKETNELKKKKINKKTIENPYLAIIL